MRCITCDVSSTPQWRKGADGCNLCNKCGVKFMKASRKAAKRSRSKPPVVGRGPSLRTTQNSRKSSQAEAPLVEAAVQMDQPVDELSGMRRKIHILKMIVSSLIGQTTSTLARKEQLLEEATDALRKREAELLLKLCRLPKLLVCTPNLSRSTLKTLENETLKTILMHCRNI